MCKRIARGGWDDKVGRVRERERKVRVSFEP